MAKARTKGRTVQPAVAAPGGRCGHRSWTERVMDPEAARVACVGLRAPAAPELWLFECVVCKLQWELLLPDGLIVEVLTVPRAAYATVRSFTKLVPGTGFISTDARDGVVGQFLRRRAVPHKAT
jgi:hypothetical protein